jgi:hypothetical protein
MSSSGGAGTTVWPPAVLGVDKGIAMVVEGVRY